jgi:hypothetical protein
MSRPIKETRPYLNSIIGLQKITSELDLHLHKQLSGQIIENQESIDQIDRILLEVNRITSGQRVSEIDLEHLNSFAKELKRLKIALIYYKENRLYDSASSSTDELFDIIDESIIKYNHDLTSIIAIIRREIADSDEKVLAGAQFILAALEVFLVTIII